MITLKIEAFGYEHEFMDRWNEEEVDMILNAPILFILSGDEDVIHQIIDGSDLLPMDSALLWSEAGEAIVFGWEEISQENWRYIVEELDIAVEGDDRGEVAA